MNEGRMKKCNESYLSTSELCILLNATPVSRCCEMSTFQAWTNIQTTDFISLFTKRYEHCVDQASGQDLNRFLNAD